MSLTVCFSADTFYYPEGGGRFWIPLNWLLGFRALGCKVVWLEGVLAETPIEQVRSTVSIMKRNLEPYGLDQCLAIGPYLDDPLTTETTQGCLDLEAATEADLLINRRYDMSAGAVRRFRRSVLLDLDPAMLQLQMNSGEVNVAPHDTYFSISEATGQPGSRFPDLGLRWHHTVPCVALNWWPPFRATDDAPFSTVAHWPWKVYGKRRAFQRYLDIPQHVNRPMELALYPLEEEERRNLEGRGWRVRNGHDVADTPWDYQAYIQRSFGEFSCTKPHTIRFRTAWVSDRTVCYLASGKPAVVQYTGPSRYLPSAGGMFRFRDPAGAIRAIESVAAEYDQQSRLARALAEEHFDARKVTARVLETALA